MIRRIDKKHVFAVLITFVIGTLMIVRFCYHTDEAVIRRRLRLLAENVSRQESDAGIRLSMKNQRLLSLFADTCRIVVPAYDVDLEIGGHELASEIFRVQSRVPEISLRFYDVNIIHAGENTARVITTAHLRAVVHDRYNSRFSDSVELNIELVKQNGKWLFTEFEEIKVLER